LNTTLKKRLERLERKRAAPVWAVLSWREDGSFFVDHAPIKGAAKQSESDRARVFQWCEALLTPGEHRSLSSL
jgi:hypothetical protein